MEYIIKDNSIDGVDVYLPKSFAFDTFEEAFDFILMMDEWEKKQIGRKRAELFKETKFDVRQ